MIKKTLAAVTIFAVTACNSLDPYVEAWPLIAIADTRSRAIEIMGEPSSVNGLEIPLVRVEQLAWKSPANQRVYMITIILDRVAAKTVVQ